MSVSCLRQRLVCGPVERAQWDFIDTWLAAQHCCNSAYSLLTDLGEFRGGSLMSRSWRSLSFGAVLRNGRINSFAGDKQCRQPAC